ncbi:MAG: HEAT repeat domain-containing protein, partial [Planctomycetota bacterium]
MKGFLVFIGILFLFGSLLFGQEDKELQTLVEQLGKPEEASQAQERMLDRFRKDDASKLWPYLKTLSTPALKGLIDVLGQLGDARCCEALAPLVKHTEVSIRLATVTALAQFDKAGLTAMEASLSDTDPLVAGTAGYYFLKASEKSEQASQSLSRAIKEVSETNALLKLLQVTALLKKEDITLGKALLVQMNNEDPKIRESAWKAFREGFPVSPEFHPQSAVSADRTKEIGELRDWLNARLIPILIEKLTVGADAEKAYQELKSRGPLVLPELEKALAHPNESVRKNSLLLIVELASRENAMKSVLKIVSEDISDLLRLTAIQIYEQSGDETGVPVLEKSLETEKNAKIREKMVLLLGKLDTKKQSLNRILTILLKDPEEAVRQACLTFLEKVEADAAVTRLLGIAATEDVSYRIRVQAIQLLYQPKWNAVDQAKAHLLALFSGNDEVCQQLQTLGLWKTITQLATEKQVLEVAPIVLGKLNILTPESLGITFQMLTALTTSLEMARLEALLPYLSQDLEAIRTSAYDLFSKHWKSQVAYAPKGTSTERESQLKQLQEELTLHKEWPALKATLQSSANPSPVEEDRLKQAGILALPILLKEFPEAEENLAAALARVFRAHSSEAVLDALIQKLSKNPSELVVLEIVSTLNAYSQKTAEEALMKLLEHSSAKIREGVIDILVKRTGSGTQLLEKLKSLAQQTTGLARIRLEIAIFASGKEEERFLKESLHVFTQSKDDPKVGETYQAFLDFVFNADSSALLNHLLDPEILKEGNFRLEFLKKLTPAQRKHLNFLRWNQILPLLSHADIPVREAAIQGLQNLIGENYGYTVGGSIEERQTAISAFEERWKEQQRILMFEEEFANFQTEVQKENWVNVRKTLEKKTEKEHTDFYTKLISFLTAPELSTSAKIGVVDILTTHTYTSVELRNQLIDTLGKLLEKETDVSLQHIAIIGLRNFSQQGVNEPLRTLFAKHLTNGDSLIRFYAVMALAWSGSNENIALLFPVLTDTEAKVRMEAAYALLALHPREALARLTPLLKDSQESVRTLTVRLINEIAASLKKASTRLNQKIQDIPLVEKDFQERGAVAFTEVSAYLSGFYSVSDEATKK